MELFVGVELTGRPTKQAPRTLVAMLSKLEEVMSTCRSRFIIEFMLGGFQCSPGGTLRFDDHRRIKPTEVTFTGSSMTTR